MADAFVWTLNDGLYLHELLYSLEGKWDNSSNYARSVKKPTGNIYVPVVKSDFQKWAKLKTTTQDYCVWHKICNSRVFLNSGLDLPDSSFYCSCLSGDGPKLWQTQKFTSAQLDVYVWKITPTEDWPEKLLSTTNTAGQRYNTMKSCTIDEAAKYYTATFFADRARDFIKLPKD